MCRSSFENLSKILCTQDTSAIVQASVATPLPDDNRGMKLLLKMGWTKETGLGKLRTGTGVSQQSMEPNEHRTRPTHSSTYTM